VAAVLGACLLVTVLRAQPTEDGPSFPDITEHFMYGSIGTEVGTGVPYWVWRVLPIVFEDLLPDRPGNGYERLGFIDEGAAIGRPIGTSYREDRVPLVGLNCATCHVGTVRESPGASPQIVPGMPANQMDLQAYGRFLAACAGDPRFTAGTIIDAIREINPDFGFFDRLFYRFFVVGRVRKGIQESAERTAWFDLRPPQGPGRVDTFNPYKQLLGLSMEGDLTVGTADLPPLWNQRVREGLPLHWDGNNDSLDERNHSAAIGAGATAASIDEPSLQRVAEWVLDLRPPPFPVTRIDAALAETGRTVYGSACARCHDLDGAEIGQVVPVERLGTDRERLDSFSADLAEAMGSIGEGYPWQFTRFRKTDGYVNMPLDGVWLRAPYLHNGSVPTLRALLFPAQRPETFYRAYDVYDWDDLGFVSAGPDAEREGVLFDTRLRGNGNGGHAYGADLPVDQKDALLEYLKTL
jgi:hypothetical protein